MLARCAISPTRASPSRSQFVTWGTSGTFPAQPSFYPVTLSQSSHHRAGRTVELRRFRYFVAVAEARSFLAAARRLKVTQPALSKQGKDLGDELGGGLFGRVARG